MRATDGTTWLPIAESARKSKISEATIRKWIERKRVAHWRLDNRLWVRHDDVLDCEREKYWRDTPA